MAEMIDVIASSDEELNRKVIENYGRSANIYERSYRTKRNIMGLLFNHQEVVGKVLVNSGSNYSHNFLSGSAAPSSGQMGFHEAPENKKHAALNAVIEQKNRLLNHPIEEKIVSNEEVLSPLIPIHPQPIVNPNIELKLETILNTVKSLSDGNVFEEPTIVEIRDILEQNDFSKKYIDKIIKRINKELPLPQLRDRLKLQGVVYRWIEESIPIAPPSIRSESSKCCKTILIGPTGVGKTTTVAKIAGKIIDEADKNAQLLLALFTIDVYRVGAIEQVKNYGEILESPVESIYNEGQMQSNLVKYQHFKNIVIDTIGRSPHDLRIHEAMYSVLSSCLDDAQVYLLFNASTRTRDIEDILDNFEFFQYQSIILTKIDETKSVGNVISALVEKGKTLAYITNGQVVPADILVASREYIMSKIIGFEDVISDFQGGK